MNLLKAIGRSDWFLKVDLVKFPILIISLIITVPLGIKAIVIGQLVTSFLAYLINTYLPGRHFGYGAWRQIKDLLPIFGIALIMALATGTVNYFIVSMWLKLIIGTFLAMMVYFGLARIIKLEEFKELTIVGNHLSRKVK